MTGSAFAEGRGIPCYASKTPLDGLRVLIDRGFSYFGQSFICDFFLIESLLKEARSLFETKLFSPSAHGAIAGNFVVLDGLGGSEQPGIKGGRSLVLLHDFRTFVGDANDGSAGLALRLLVDDGEHLLQPIDLSFGFDAVLLECFLELLVLSGLCHLGQS